MKVIDDFLPEQYQKSIEGLLLSPNFSWHLSNYTYEGASPYTMANTTEGVQLTHTLFHGVVASEHYWLIAGISHQLMLKENINTTNVMRVKANLNTVIPNYPDGHHYSVHIDPPKGLNAITCIYYVNDSDGDTILFDAEGINEVKRISPKKNRFVYFDSNTPHAGCPPKNHQTRCLINFNFMLGV